MVLGQVPPPHGGQTIMTDALLRGKYENAELLHVNTAFSTSLSKMARPSFRKVGRLFTVLGRALWVRIVRRPTVLYYHPAGANRSAILRDVVILTVLRPLFPLVVFHMHARGLPETCAALPRALGRLVRRAYACPDVVLGPSTAVVQEAAPLAPRYSRVIANGTQGGDPRMDYRTAGSIEILFLNLISEAKGASWLLEAFAELRAGGVDARLTLVGEFASSTYRTALIARSQALGVDAYVSMPGTATGAFKWEAMKAADIFCVPTTWPQESFGLVLIEAASCGLPVVAADVPGVREVLRPGISVLLADPDDRSSLGRQLGRLCVDPAVREHLGTAARLLFEERYTLERFWAEMSEVFTKMSEDLRAAS